MQLGKKTSGDMIDPEPERKEGFATATFDLEAIRWQRARYTSQPLVSGRQVVDFISRTLLTWRSLPSRRHHIVSILQSPVHTITSAQCCVAGDSSETGVQTCMDPC